MPDDGAAGMTVTGGRVVLGAWPTPLHPVARFSGQAGCGPLLVKRDDLAGFVLAGNKTRPLEYLLGAALAAGCDALVTGGRPDSNFIAAAAAGCAVAGLGCHLVVAEHRHAAKAPNLALAAAFGARVHPTAVPADRLDERIAACARRLDGDGARAFVVPRGGSTPVGAQGFADAAHELHRQLADGGVEPAAIVCAVGSGGTYAGLLCGAAELGWPWPVIGVSVSRPLDEARAVVRTLADAVAERRGTPRVPGTAVRLVDAVHPGHGRADPEQRALAAELARTEGILLDETYTAKAFRTAVALAGDGDGTGAPVVFWHTGAVLNALDRLLCGAQR